MESVNEQKVESPVRVWTLVYLLPLRLTPGVAYWVMSTLELVWALLFIWNCNLVKDYWLFIGNAIVCFVFFFVKVFALIRRTSAREKAAIVVRSIWSLFTVVLLTIAFVQTMTCAQQLVDSINASQSTSLQTSDIQRYLTPVYVAAPILVVVALVHIVWNLTFWRIVNLSGIKKADSMNPEVKISTEGPN